MSATQSGVGKPFDEAAARAILAKRDPVSGTVEMVGGRPMFVTSDGARSTVIYKHLGAASHKEFGEAGIHLQYCMVPDAGAAGSYDLLALERNILRCLWEDPRAYVIVELNCDPMPQWGAEHLDAVWTAEDGQPWLYVPTKWTYRKGTVPEPGENFRHDSPSAPLMPPEKVESFQGSFGSPTYLDYMAERVRALGDFLRTHEVGKVVVGFHFWGGSDGEFWPIIWYHLTKPTLEDWQLDHSKGSIEGFRQWLREVYSDDVSALRHAWGDSSVTFETADLCSEGDRVSNQPFFRGEGKAQHVVDSQKWFSVSRNRMLKCWSKEFKKAIGKPVFALAWSSDALYGLNLGHCAVSELLEDPDRLESTSSTSAYGETRAPGGPGRTFLCWGAYRLRGAVAVRELDNRPRPAKEFRAQIIRDIGEVASRGMGVWFYEMESPFRPHPELWPTFAEANRIMEWAFRDGAPSPVAEMAVFVDEEAGHRASKNHQDILMAYTMGQRDALTTSGVPYDIYYLDDIRNPKLPDYKVYLFLSTFTLNKAQVEAIKQRCGKPGKAIAFLGPVGIGSPDYDDPAALPRELRSIEGATTMLLAAPEEGGGLTAQLVHDWAKLAGINAMGTPGQVTHIGSGVAVCHRLQEGPAKVTFGEPVDLIDPKDGTTLLAQGVTEWEPQCEINDTAVVFYRPVGKQ